VSIIKDTFFGGAEKKAAKAQEQAADRAIQEQRSAREQARGDLAPYASTGQRALNPLYDFVMNNPNSDLERAQGFQDIQNSAAASGKLRSGGTLKELTSFNNMLNERNRNQRFSELFNLATLGSNAAAGQATTTLNTANQISEYNTQRGNATAAGKIGAANKIGDTVFQVLGMIPGIPGGAGG